MQTDIHNAIFRLETAKPTRVVRWYVLDTGHTVVMGGCETEVPAGTHGFTYLVASQGNPKAETLESLHLLEIGTVFTFFFF